MVVMIDSVSDRSHPIEQYPCTLLKAVKCLFYANRTSNLAVQIAVGIVIWRIKLHAVDGCICSYLLAMMQAGKSV